MPTHAVPTLSELPPPPPGKTGWPWTEAGPPAPTLPEGAELPVVGVVTPSYQQAEFIEETLRSVLLQGYPRLSYVVVDGGSTDGSQAIIEKYAPWLAGWVSERDGGQAEAIDKGFARCGGTLLTWLNSDDVLAPGAMWRAVEAFARQPQAVLVYGHADEIARDGAWLRRAAYVVPTDRRQLIHSANVIPQPAAYFRREAYEAAGRLDHTLHWCMDYDLWIRLAGLGPLVLVPHTLAHLRIYPEAKTSSGAPAMFEEFRRVGERYGGYGLLNQMQWIVPTLMPKALAALREGDLPRGQAWLTSVIANDPAWRSVPRLAELLANEAWDQMTAGASPAAALHWLRAVCAGLPGQHISASAVERRATGRVRVALAYRHAHQRRAADTLRQIALAVRADLGQARNRGLWRLAARSLLGWRA